ncbi:hypothetical protein [Pedobacter antarcticus]|uniref:hypothetical protein n=1 Tax=Pedobacter antarcticus TaxID=34086 RepID=UPI000888DCFE|nr:hypothetical protein [Pedobacter antarcticus]SDL86022.1 hypothetical protein SAMN04488084_102701 [Pedobacter antarcticus]
MEIIFSFFKSLNHETWIAVYAAILSTALTLREIYLKRARIDTSYFFTAEYGTHDVITIYNMSEKSIAISNFEFFYSKYKILSSRKYLSTGREQDHINFSIGSHSTFDWEIDEQYKFKLPSNKNLYLRMKVMGKRCYLVKCVYAPSRWWSLH